MWVSSESKFLPLRAAERARECQTSGSLGVEEPLEDALRPSRDTEALGYKTKSGVWFFVFVFFLGQLPPAP